MGEKAVMPIKDHLRPITKELIQGRIDSHLKYRVEKIMKAHGLKWGDLLTACLKEFLKETEGKNDV